MRLGGCFYAGFIAAALGIGRVIVVDIEIRPHDRAAIEAHPMARADFPDRRSSVAPATVGKRSVPASLRTRTLPW